MQSMRAKFLFPCFQTTNEQHWHILQELLERVFIDSTEKVRDGRRSTGTRRVLVVDCHQIEFVPVAK